VGISVGWYKASDALVARQQSRAHSTVVGLPPMHPLARCICSMQCSALPNFMCPRHMMLRHAMMMMQLMLTMLMLMLMMMQ
jgi:hypothetical protein